MTDIRREDLEQANLENKWVKTTTPTTNDFFEKKTFNHYGRLIRITDDYIVLFSKRAGLCKIPLENILNIGVARKPDNEV